MNLAVNELHWLGHSPMKNMKMPKESKPRQRYLSNEEINRLLRVYKDEKVHIQVYPVVFLAIRTGIRLSEVNNTLLENLDTKDKSILLADTKNDEPHMIYLTDEVSQILQQHINHMLKLRPYNWRDVSVIHNKLYYNGREHLFPSLQKADKPVYLKNAWVKVRKLARLNDGKVVFHTLRHTSASLLARQGKTLNDIAHV